MTTCRESDHAHFFRINFPCGSIPAYDSHGLLGILKGTNGFISHYPVGREPVFENNSGYSIVVKPSCNSIPFVIKGKCSVSSARADQNRGAVGFGGIGEKNSQIGSHNIVGTCNPAVGCSYVFYVGRIIFRTWNAVGP